VKGAVTTEKRKFYFPQDGESSLLLCKEKERLALKEEENPPFTMGRRGDMDTVHHFKGEVPGLRRMEDCWRFSWSGQMLLAWGFCALFVVRLHDSLAKKSSSSADIQPGGISQKKGFILILLGASKKGGSSGWEMVSFSLQRGGDKILVRGGEREEEDERG